MAQRLTNPMITLTDKNYYEKGTGALTCSKIKDYSICPNYFFHKHILCDLKEEKSDAFAIGGLVDDMLSGVNYLDRYMVVDRRTADAKQSAAEAGIVLILKSQLDEAVKIVAAVDETSAWKTIKEKGRFQDILQIPMKLNDHFDSIAGKPDVWWLDPDGTCYIVDLKTAMTADHKNFYFRAIGFHYDWQLANYKMLLSSIYPQIERFKCYNFVVSKVKDIYSTQLFQYPGQMIEAAESAMIKMIDKISKEKNYAKYNPTFDRPVLFGDFENDKLSAMIEGMEEEE